MNKKREILIITIPSLVLVLLDQLMNFVVSNTSYVRIFCVDPIEIGLLPILYQFSRLPVWTVRILQFVILISLTIWLLYRYKNNTIGYWGKAVLILFSAVIISSILDIFFYGGFWKYLVINDSLFNIMDLYYVSGLLICGVLLFIFLIDCVIALVKESKKEKKQEEEVSSSDSE